MSQQLQTLLNLLGQLTYDELIDFADHAGYELAIKQGHSGEKGAHFRAEAELRRIRAGRKGRTWQAFEGAYRDAILAAAKLEPDDRKTAITVANTLSRALQPVERRRKRRAPGGQVEEVATGVVEVKAIKVPVYDPLTGARARDEQGRPLSRGPGPIIAHASEIPAGYGPYVYVRVWATGGGRDRKLRRLRSRYVGSQGLASAFMSLEPESPERVELAEKILDLYVGGGASAVREWAAELFPDPEEAEEGAE